MSSLKLQRKLVVHRRGFVRTSAIKYRLCCRKQVSTVCAESSIRTNGQYDEVVRNRRCHNTDLETWRTTAEAVVSSRSSGCLRHHHCGMGREMSKECDIRRWGHSTLRMQGAQRRSNPGSKTAAGPFDVQQASSLSRFRCPLGRR